MLSLFLVRDARQHIRIAACDDYIDRQHIRQATFVLLHWTHEAEALTPWAVSRSS